MIEFKARAMMEKAIEVMRESVPENRQDGKVTPKVGAVLIDVSDKAPGYDRMMTACRGELRDGDHAEFTVIERKHRDRNLENCVLFATLEPCAPNSRKHPKLGCAERIVNARIKEVWMGIKDPYPTVAGEGKKYLEDNGVQVHMFDRDLQEIILEENRDFIKQAEKAAAEAKEKQPVADGSLKDTARHVKLDDLDEKALGDYQYQFLGSHSVGMSAFRPVLVRQGILAEQGDTFVPTGFGMLLFGRHPRTAMPQAGLLGTIHFADGTEETQDFDGPTVQIPDAVLKWLTDKLPNVIDRSGATRKQTTKDFLTLVREGVVNALVHRDYSIEGAKCQLVVTSNRIEIRSPGGPESPVTVEQLQSFSAPLLSRNPVMHYVFSQMRLAEERGLGLKSLKEKATALGLPLPRFSWEEPYLVLTLFRSLEASSQSLPDEIRTELNESELEGWEWFSTQGRTKSREYASALKIETRTARRHLNRFTELGLARKTGSGPATEYEVT